LTASGFNQPVTRWIRLRVVFLGASETGTASGISSARNFSAWIGAGSLVSLTKAVESEPSPASVRAASVSSTLSIKPASKSNLAGISTGTGSTFPAAAASGLASAAEITVCAASGVHSGSGSWGCAACSSDG
jgi:hypothetical protein